MKMLSWMSGNILKYQVKNENIQENLRGSNKKVKRERLVYHDLVMYKKAHRCTNVKPA